MSGEVWVVVPAAGIGRRTGLDYPKQYVELAGRPLLYWTLEVLLRHPRIAGAVVALSADDRHWPGWSALEGKPVLTATGGDDRAASVRAGLEALEGRVGGDDWVLVHDAARPCLDHADLDRLLDLGCAHPVGALLAAPVADTLKQANDRGESLGNLPRERARRALTPQLFRHSALCSALDRARADGATVTDEASAFEHLGLAPLLVPGSARNLKVTTAGDFELAAFLLRAAGRGG
jgi:2-C-methyl-D-erythritol 4-phosphate cytidylyltransferase